MFNLWPSLILVIMVFGAQLRRRFSGKAIKIIWTISLVWFFGWNLYFSYQQYLGWKTSPLGRYFLPPYQSWAYFFSYVGLRFFGPYIISLAAALILSWLALALNRRCEERFFESEETIIFGLAVFLTGYPGFLFYLAFLLLIFLIAHPLYSKFYILNPDKNQRLSLYYFWLPVAILAIIIKNWLIPVGFLEQFNL